MNSPIQLLSRKFLDIELHSQSLDGGKKGFDMSHMIAVVQDAEEPTHWRVKLGVRIANKEEEQSAPYLGEITIAGHFQLAEDFPTEKAEQMVYLNSGALLYGAIRELILSLTSQSIHGELILPAIDARSFLPKSEEKKEETSS